jgi:multiple sugar transport system ATP-binding protein
MGRVAIESVYERYGDGAFVVANATRVGICSEHIELCDADAPDALPAVITVVEPAGSETVVQAEAAGMPPAALIRERVRIGYREKVDFRLQRQHMHLFVGATDNGRRLDA